MRPKLARFRGSTSYCPNPSELVSPAKGKWRSRSVTWEAILAENAIAQILTHKGGECRVIYWVRQFLPASSRELVDHQRTLCILDTHQHVSAAAASRFNKATCCPGPMSSATAEDYASAHRALPSVQDSIASNIQTIGRSCVTQGLFEYHLQFVSSAMLYWQRPCERTDLHGRYPVDPHNLHAIRCQVQSEHARSYC